MKLYRKICYKVENIFIKIMSKGNQNFEINIEKAERFRKNKEMKKIQKKSGNKMLEV